MKALVDTSVVVRYLTGDPPDMAERAASILDRRQGLAITDVVIVETAYVLTSVYGIPRDIVVDHLIAFLQKKNIRTLGISKDLLFEGLLLCRPSQRVSFADAVVWAAARQNQIPRIFTFDGRFPSEGVEIADQ